MPSYIDYNGKSIEIPDMNYKDEVMAGLKNGTLDTSLLKDNSATSTEISGAIPKAAMSAQAFLKDLQERGGKALNDAPSKLVDELAFNIGRVGNFLFDTPLEGVGDMGDPGKGLTTGSGQTLKLRPEVADAALMFTPGSAIKAGGTAAAGAASLLYLMNREVDKSGLKAITKALKSQQGMIGGESNIDKDLLSLAKKYIAKERVKFNDKFAGTKKELADTYKAYHASKIGSPEEHRLYAKYSLLGHKLLKESPEYSTFKKFGIYPGKDGVWREVISDEGATLNKDALNSILPYASRSMKMEDFLQHPKLYKKYPELAKRKVKFINDDANGNVSKEYGYLGINPNDKTKPITVIRNINDKKGIMDTISTLLHENQHEIQNLEGMGSGGNTTESRNYLKRVLLDDGMYARNHSYQEEGDAGFLESVADRHDAMIQKINQYPPDTIYNMLLGERDASATQRMFETGNFDVFPESMKPISPDVNPDIVVQYPKERY